MSKVIYKVGEESFGFNSKLQYINNEQLFQLEERLMEEIKEHKHHLNPQPQTGFIHGVWFEDDNGNIGTISDFKKPGNLIIRRTDYETENF